MHDSSIAKSSFISSYFPNLATPSQEIEFSFCIELKFPSKSEKSLPLEIIISECFLKIKSKRVRILSTAELSYMHFFKKDFGE